MSRTDVHDPDNLGANCERLVRRGAVKRAEAAPWGITIRFCP
jgi:hypothetical protein